jgi:shikimate dehydrogenase
MNEITGNYKILGVIGNPIEHSLSPVFQNYLIRNSRTKYVYIPFKVNVNGLKDFFQGIRTIKNIKGFNVTIPFKEKCIIFADELSDEAKRIGAVNTFLIDNDKFYGFNTDIYGIIFTLKFKLKINDLENKRVVIIGAGGASRTAMYCLKQLNCNEVFLVNRTKERFDMVSNWAEKVLKLEIKYIQWEDLSSLFSKYTPHLVINATPLGLKGEKIKLDFSKADKNAKVFDMTYNVKSTFLVKKAKEYSIDAVDGLAMLIAQGVESFRIWTGISFEEKKVLYYMLRRLKHG